MSLMPDLLEKSEAMKQSSRNVGALAQQYSQLLTAITSVQLFVKNLATQPQLNQSSSATETCSISIGSLKKTTTAVIVKDGRPQTKLEVHGSEFTRLTFPGVTPGNLKVPPTLLKNAAADAENFLKNAVVGGSKTRNSILANAIFKYCTCVVRYYEKGSSGPLQYGKPGFKLTTLWKAGDGCIDFALTQPDPAASAMYHACRFFKEQLKEVGKKDAKLVLNSVIHHFRIHLSHTRDRAHLKRRRPVSESSSGSSATDVTEDTAPGTSGWLKARPGASSVNVERVKPFPHGNEY